MLTHNLWTEKGLVNGTIGTVVNIFYDETKSSPEDLPFAIICKFDSYKGPYLDDNSKLIPISRIHPSWENKGNIDCTRQQFPLKLAFGITIHKSQGLTLDKVVINIGKKEFSAGLTYVALSRCRTFDNIMIEPFNFNRFLQIKTSKANKQRMNFWKTVCPVCPAIVGQNLENHQLSASIIISEPSPIFKIPW
ncbi:hypothetical protein FOCC_FOCC016134 [Frankliniella occidentalis]|nr:hypothetical protein FOCC_FOCC016134 [Frankliniella occidentalis]